MVAARHLSHFGYSPALVIPKLAKAPLFQGLQRQLEQLGLPISTQVPSSEQMESYALVVDGIFGFSFKGWRGSGKDAPYDQAVKQLAELETPVVSIDIPSGWHVEDGPVEPPAISPQMLISLTAPKLCARHFRGESHYLGGRFVTPQLQEHFNLTLPAYPGSEQCVKIIDHDTSSAHL